MPLKTILTYVDGAAGDGERLASAIAAARRFDAHLNVLAVAYVPEIVADPYPGIASPVYEAEVRARASVEAKDLARATTDRMAAEGIRGDAVPLATTPSMLAREVGDRALYADLVVLQWFTSAGGDAHAREAFEGALFQGEATVLLGAAASDLRPKLALIAWDGSTTALHAVRRAEPFLKGVAEIEICMVDPAEWQAASAEQLALMLSRHGLTASIWRAASEGETEATALVRRQLETGAGLTVQGGYGHSRLREMVLGGVTRQLPEISKTPLVLAH